MDDLVIEFIAETTESISALDNEIVKLEQNPNDTDLLNSIFRLMHTIKGTCGFLGLGKLEKVAHAGENVLDKLRHKELPVTSAAISFILESIDRIKELLCHLAEHGVEPDVDNSVLIKKLNDFAEGKTISADEKPKKAQANAPEPDEHGFVPVPASQMMEPDEHGFVPVPANQMAEPDEHGFVPVPAIQLSAAAEDKAKVVAIEEGLKAKAESAKNTPVTNAQAKPASNESIRVNIDTLENLMQLVSELVLTRNQLMQVLRSSKQSETDFANPLQRLSHITSDLQEGIMQTRMQPIGNAWNKLPRIIRDLSLELNKKIDLKMYGEDTELDRQLLELIKDPLTHMVRNSADHGIEMPAERIAAGKPEVGTVTLRAYHEAGYIIVEIKDDGKGLNIDRIKQKAIQNGIATAEQVEAMNNKQIFQFIFAAGFSTAEKVTAVSGRGVGMDVVRTNIEKMGGSIELDSEQGKGSVFQIKIPLTLAIMPVLIFESANEKFAIPQINVTELVRVDSKSENKIEKINNSPVLRLRGSLLPLIKLDKVLKAPTVKNIDEKNFVVVCEIGNFSFGVIVDKIFDSEEIVVKPVSTALRGINIYSGSTILGDGSVIMILDPNGLVKTISQTVHKNTKEEVIELRDEDQPVSFLLFRAGHGAPKAVPLELVSRLEEIDPKEIEHAGDINVIQYRGDLMRLTQIDDSYKLKTADQGKQQFIVFTDEGKVLGLAVEEILDIVKQPMSISMNSTSDGFLGSMVIAGKTTDVVDVGHYFSKVFKDWRIHQEEKDRIKRGAKILLVEDSPFFRKLMVPVLMTRGYEIKTASDGVQALKVLSEDKSFNLIITDIDMPNMNGLDFAEKCKSDDSIKNIPIIALTANNNIETIKRGRKIGLANHIAKSDREKLFETVVDIIEPKLEAIHA